ncbi:MAG: hypothetical protein ACN4GW_00045, partial [Desulforhopalus sp.]
TGKGVAAGAKLFKPMYEAMENLKTGRFGFTETKVIIPEWTEGDWARESGTLVLREIYKSPFLK